MGQQVRRPPRVTFLYRGFRADAEMRLSRDETVWRFIQEDGITGARAAATEAFLAGAYARGGTMPDPTLRIFTYQPDTLLLGRFQSAAAQFRLAECKRLGIAVNRRLTGGGAVLMGAQQVAISFTTCVDHSSTPSQLNDMFTVYSGAVGRGLRRVGVECRFRPRHDFLVGSSKLAIADVRIDPSGAVVFQAHVLLDFDAHNAAGVLSLPHDMTQDRAEAVLAERLTSLKRERPPAVEPSVLRDFMRVAFESGFGVEFQEFPITPLENDGIAQLERDRYGTEQWLHDRSPTTHMSGMAARETAGGLLLAFSSMAGKQITGAVAAGDFFGDWAPLHRFEDSLRGLEAGAESVRNAAVEHIRPGALEGIDATDVADVVSEALASAGRVRASPDEGHGSPQSFM